MQVQMIQIKTGVFIFVFFSLCMAGCHRGGNGRATSPATPELVSVSVYKWGLDTGSAKVDIESRRLQGLGTRYRKDMSLMYLDAQISTTEVDKLRQLVVGSTLKGFVPRPSWFKRAIEEHRDDRLFRCYMADWGRSLMISWKDEQVAFEIPVYELRTYLPEVAKEKYSRVDAITEYILDLETKYAATSRVVVADKYMIDHLHSELDRISETSVP